jgi:hypothetical protein
LTTKAWFGVSSIKRPRVRRCASSARCRCRTGQSDENCPILDSISRSNHRRCAILSHLIPLFRRLVTSGHYEKMPPKIFVFAALGVIIIQVCYCLDQHWFLTLRLGHNPLLGHLILFLSRLNFIFAGAVFSAVYLVRFNELDISVWGFVFLFTVLFSIFCYSLELERLGRALVERKDRS